MENKHSVQVSIKIHKITEISREEKKITEAQILSCVLLNWVSNDPRKGWEPGPVHRSFTDHNHPSLSLHSCPVLSDIWHLSLGTEHEKIGSNNRRLQLHWLSFSWISARNNNSELWAKTPVIREVITDRNNFSSTGTMMSPLLKRGTSEGTKKLFIISSRSGSEACRRSQNTPVIKNPDWSPERAKRMD